jgi:hypothetical protein
VTRRGGRWLSRRIHRILLAVIAAVLTAGGCTQPPSRVSETALAGTWNVEISRGRLPWTRRTVHGQIHLSSSPLRDKECNSEEEQRRPDAFLCETHVEGTYSIPLDSLVRPHPYAGWTADVDAMAMADGRIVLQIGGCCDRGEIIATGRIQADRMQGGWYQQFLNDGPGGRFVLRRAPEP